MASGGWFGNLLQMPFRVVNSLFDAGSETYSASTSAYPQVRASDLVSSTQATTPDSPVMGSEDTGTKKRKRGLSQLYVNNNGNSGTGSSNDFTGRSGL